MLCCRSRNDAASTDTFFYIGTQSWVKDIKRRSWKGFASSDRDVAGRSEVGVWLGYFLIKAEILYNALVEDRAGFG